MYKPVVFPENHILTDIQFITNAYARLLVLHTCSVHTELLMEALRFCNTMPLTQAVEISL